MLGVLFSTDKGTALVFITGLFVLPVLISVISLVIKLVFIKKRKYYLPRPLLTILMFIGIIGIANWTYEIALEQAVSAAEEINRQCNEKSACPENPAGWKVRDYRISRDDFGYWFTYQASYSSKATSFEIYLYRGPDVGDSISGGVGQTIKVVANTDN